MRRFLKWFLMLNKRLYKKATFLVILALIPICIFSFSMVAEQESGMVHIVLAQTDKNDALSSQVVDKLMNEESVVNFTKASSPEEAINDVKTGVADEAWIFPENMQEKIDEFISEESKGFISIVAREKTVLLNLSHEKLSSVLYEHCAKAYYINYARTNLQELNSLGEEELIEYFDNAGISEELFVFGNSSGSKLDDGQQSNYLITPIRGLLGVLIVISGMAAAMYYMQDDISGTFSWISQKGKKYIAFCSLLIAVLNVAGIALISLFVSGTATDVWTELLSVVLYSVCCTVFCLLLKQIFGSIKLYGAIIPLLIVIMIAVCPIFFDFRSFLGVQLIFPPTYYVNAVYDSKYLLYMVVYSAFGMVLCFLLGILQKIKINSLLPKINH